MQKRKPTPEEIRDALHAFNGEPDPIDELIANGEAIYALLNLTELDMPTKGIVFQLEKQFMFFAEMVQKMEGGSKG